MPEVSRCAACRDAVTETNFRGRVLLRCRLRGPRGERGRVVDTFPEDGQSTQAPPVWCERRRQNDQRKSAAFGAEG